MHFEYMETVYICNCLHLSYSMQWHKLFIFISIGGFVLLMDFYWLHGLSSYINNYRVTLCLSLRIHNEPCWYRMVLLISQCLIIIIITFILNLVSFVSGTSIIFSNQTLFKNYIHEVTHNKTALLKTAALHFSDDGAAVRVRCSLPGLLYTASYSDSSSRVTVDYHNYTNETIIIHKPISSDQHVSVSWSNSSHYTLNDEIGSCSNFSGLDVIRYYKPNDVLQIGFYDLTVTWSQPLCVLPTLCYVSRVSGSCVKYNKTSVKLTGIRANSDANSDGNLVTKLILLGVTTSFSLPGVSIQCPIGAKYCTRKCTKPGVATNVSTSLLNDTTLLVQWRSPYEPGDGVAMYVVRWGFISTSEDNPPSTFPLNTTRAWFALTGDSTADEFQQVSFSIQTNRNETDVLYLAVQVVGLCNDTISELPNVNVLTAFNESNDVISDWFSPARYDVIHQLNELALKNGTKNLKPNISASESNLHREVDVNSIVLPATVTAVFIVIVVVLLSVLRSRSTKFHLPPLSMNPIYKALYADLKEPDHWEISYNSIMWGEEIGSGAFGHVYKCALNNNKSSCTVAVKILNDVNDELQCCQFVQEILVMKGLRQHPNVLGLIGCVTLSEPICLVMEYACNGDLLAYLHAQRQADSESMQFGTEGLSEQQALQIAYEVACGMEYISSQGYIHRDLAARNLLLDENYSVKIADFGLARYLHTEDIYVVQKSRRMPIKWLSIEAISDLTFSVFSDVWAFGIVLFEIVTLGATPYPSIEPEFVLKYLKDGKRIEKPQGCSDDIYRLMKPCWQEEPSERPSFTDLKYQIAQMISSVTYTNIVGLYSRGNLPSLTDEGFVSDPSVPTRSREPSNSDSSDYSDTHMIIENNTEDDMENLEECMKFFYCYMEKDDDDNNITDIKSPRMFSHKLGSEILLEIINSSDCSFV